MRILVTGATGQVGWELRRSLASLGEVIAPGRAALDLSQPRTVAAAVRALRPQLIVNPAAYTAVDKAESEPALAQAVNAESVAVLAAVSRELDALLVHYSTDYVFDGSQAAPYRTTDATNPVSAYGRSKLAGEQAIAASGCRHLMLRTSWVYGARGKNFLLTMLKLARERDGLRVVADQFGAPTSSRLIADTTAQLLARIAPGTTPAEPLLHLTGTGRTSWHGFASRIVEWGAELGLCKLVPVAAIGTADYPTPAARPANSSLDVSLLERTYGLQLPPWETSLRLCLEDFAALH
ncbi:MAG: dTDP-4-dehydrorhamnose reductase [Pseudomonadota bacterium]